MKYQCSSQQGSTRQFYHKQKQSAGKAWDGSVKKKLQHQLNLCHFYANYISVSDWLLVIDCAATTWLSAETSGLGYFKLTHLSWCVLIYIWFCLLKMCKFWLFSSGFRSKFCRPNRQTGNCYHAPVENSIDQQIYKSIISQIGFQCVCLMFEKLFKCF